MVSVLIEDTITSTLPEEVSVFWLLRENSAKKVSEAFW